VAVLAKPLQLDGPADDPKPTVGPRPVDTVLMGGPVALGNDAGQRLAHHLRRRIPEHPFGGIVP